jgi:hypothetical protein
MIPSADDPRSEIYNSTNGVGVAEEEEEEPEEEE